MNKGLIDKLKNNLLFKRYFSNLYSYNIKKNVPEYIDFETFFPKREIKPDVLSPFTMSKQQRLEKLLEDNPLVLYKGRVIKKLSCPKIKHSGRNDVGKITTRHRGGGHVQRLRFIDFKRSRKDIYSTVLRIEYDPTRSAHIALIQYEDGVLSYILAPLLLRPGDKVIASRYANIHPGNALPLKNIPIGSLIHNIEMRPGAGGQLIRAAGTYATVLSKDSLYATIKLKSTEIRKFPLECWATIGQVANLERHMRILGKAGVNRWLGKRPVVRGVAMNPSKHPHGGGTSKKHTKRPKCSLWGKCRDGFKTRSKKKPLGLIIRRNICGRLQKKYGVTA
ncbi:ribosomal protein L2 [Plasmodium yoelii 17X]|uniref:50S ribosomal protein L2 n=4 Tax=Plasmodium yoelii TaxID=5861 RepID=A0AAF0B5G3_PLAYO|nr:50S ribosomal protein L2, putative [Plasmodium yoelii]EAA18079.1 ribosomal protein L2 [Plasmodium yoelii yoelii]ETB57618.1 ribosomal protein L2 [Plasmodium yoelii 17X]WBY57270.1 50S ribosomal protein L2 [Plasmodium yoelii yoelii]CDU17946.1 mitochondrial ribosomal protein L2 precursor, putative [Plasmodium yoelii]VTZ78363.1 50S ribosomal protein L2, putative [Plasmodium yoelii]|eukprot:XP_726514.1 50S ribosomal protein L2, putative [Plasmodium yoelii]